MYSNKPIKTIYYALPVITGLNVYSTSSIAIIFNFIILITNLQQKNLKNLRQMPKVSEIAFILSLNLLNKNKL